jgi:hypothetical protein
MDSQQVRNLQEAYLGVYNDLDEAYTPGPTQAEIRSREKEQRANQVAAAAKQPGYGGDDKMKGRPLMTVNPGDPEQSKKVLKQTQFKLHKPTGNPTRIMSPKLATNRQAAAIDGMIRGREVNNPQASSLPKGKNREIVRRNINASYDLYDVILSHLLDEGYAETVENAEAIMVNMSEDWKNSIIG